MSGTSHQAEMRAELRIAGRISPTATATANPRRPERVRVGAERDHYERDLETFEHDALEGQYEGEPVEALTAPFGWLVLGVQADAGEAVGRDPHDALAEPLQTEDEKEGADDQPKRPDRNSAEREAEGGDDHREHREARRDAEPGRAPAARRPHAQHDRDHLHGLDRRCAAGRDEDDGWAGHSLGLSAILAGVVR